MNMKRNYFVSGFIAIFFLIASLPLSAIQGATFMKLKNEIQKSIPEAIVLKDVTFNEKQIVELGDALSTCTPYLNTLSLIGLKDSSKKTEELFYRLRNNASLINLELNNSYLSDEAMKALIILLTPSESNKSKIERLSLDGAKASNKAWLSLASAMGNFNLQKISLRGIAELYSEAINPEKIKDRLLVLDPMLKELENSLSDVARLTLVLAINTIKTWSLIDDLKKNTRHLVNVKYEDKFSPLWWASITMVSTASIIIAYANSEVSQF